jgi:hypothetical protein
MDIGSTADMERGGIVDMKFGLTAGIEPGSVADKLFADRLFAVEQHWDPDDLSTMVALVSEAWSRASHDTQSFV